MGGYVRHYWELDTETGKAIPKREWVYVRELRRTQTGTVQWIGDPRRTGPRYWADRRTEGEQSRHNVPLGRDDEEDVVKRDPTDWSGDALWWGLVNGGRPLRDRR